MKRDYRIVDNPNNPMGYKYRCRIVETTKGIWRKRVAYRPVIEIYFMFWRFYCDLPKKETKEAAIKAGNKYLNQLDYYPEMDELI